MRAILVCVDYSDLLEVTLPYNRHHFDEIMVVTSQTDIRTRSVAAFCDCQVHITDAFYADNAVFNKWRALEEALDVYGRHGWLCLMDADVLWPKALPDFHMEKGNLYTPLRRMFTNIRQPVPPEDQWERYRVHRNIHEWAGYSQIFHADDPMLGDPPWHETNWMHAGGADSYFQKKWPSENKIRPPFDVLHLGEDGVNWMGRSSAYMDGSTHPEANQRRKAMSCLMLQRRRRKFASNDYADERI